MNKSCTSRIKIKISICCKIIKQIQCNWQKIMKNCNKILNENKYLRGKHLMNKEKKNNK